MTTPVSNQQQWRAHSQQQPQQFMQSGPLGQPQLGQPQLGHPLLEQPVQVQRQWPLSHQMGPWQQPGQAARPILVNVPPAAAHSNQLLSDTDTANESAVETSAPEQPQPQPQPRLRQLRSLPDLNRQATPHLASNSMTNLTEQSSNTAAMATTTSAAAAANTTVHKQRPFNHKWLDRYDWLAFDAELNKMYCRSCRACGRQGPFARDGSRNFKTSALKDHDTSSDHMHFYPIYNEQQRRILEQEQQQEQQQKQEQQQRQQPAQTSSTNDITAEEARRLLRDIIQTSASENPTANPPPRLPGGARVWLDKTVRECAKQMARQSQETMLVEVANSRGFVLVIDGLRHWKPIAMINQSELDSNNDGNSGSRREKRSAPDDSSIASSPRSTNTQQQNDDFQPFGLKRSNSHGKLFSFVNALSRVRSSSDQIKTQRELGAFQQTRKRWRRNEQNSNNSSNNDNRPAIPESEGSSPNQSGPQSPVTSKQTEEVIDLDSMRVAKGRRIAPLNISRLQWMELDPESDVGASKVQAAVSEAMGKEIQLLLYLRYIPPQKSSVSQLTDAIEAVRNNNSDSNSNNNDSHNLGLPKASTRFWRLLSVPPPRPDPSDPTGTRPSLDSTRDLFDTICDALEDARLPIDGRWLAVITDDDDSRIADSVWRETSIWRHVTRTLTTTKYLEGSIHWEEWQYIASQNLKMGRMHALDMHVKGMDMIRQLLRFIYNYSSKLQSILQPSTIRDVVATIGTRMRLEATKEYSSSSSSAATAKATKSSSTSSSGPGFGMGLSAMPGSAYVNTPTSATSLSAHSTTTSSSANSNQGYMGSDGQWYKTILSDSDVRLVAARARSLKLARSGLRHAHSNSTILSDTSSSGMHPFASSSSDSTSHPSPNIGSRDSATSSKSIEIQPSRDPSDETLTANEPAMLNLLPLRSIIDIADNFFNILRYIKNRLDSQRPGPDGTPGGGGPLHPQVYHGLCDLYERFSCIETVGGLLFTGDMASLCLESEQLPSSSMSADLPGTDFMWRPPNWDAAGWPSRHAWRTRAILGIGMCDEQSDDNEWGLPRFLPGLNEAANYPSPTMQRSNGQSAQPTPAGLTPQQSRLRSLVRCSRVFAFLGQLGYDALLGLDKDIPPDADRLLYYVQQNKDQTIASSVSKLKQCAKQLSRTVNNARFGLGTNTDADDEQNEDLLADTQIGSTLISRADLNAIRRPYAAPEHRRPAVNNYGNYHETPPAESEMIDMTKPELLGMSFYSTPLTLKNLSMLIDGMGRFGLAIQARLRPRLRPLPLHASWEFMFDPRRWPSASGHLDSAAVAALDNHGNAGVASIQAMYERVLQHSFGLAEPPAATATATATTTATASGISGLSINTQSSAVPIPAPTEGNPSQHRNWQLDPRVHFSMTGDWAFLKEDVKAGKLTFKISDVTAASSSSSPVPALASDLAMQAVFDGFNQLPYSRIISMYYNDLVAATHHPRLLSELSVTCIKVRATLERWAEAATAINTVNQSVVNDHARAIVRNQRQQHSESDHDAVDAELAVRRIALHELDESAEWVLNLAQLAADHIASSCRS
ncbi:hypothetical protein GQ42DRAFT_55403 [Ramicandelaber brevisporus]|nr:hypothetical protein GQ42DRAFT_55403 [Ramicandelaber brevisporus]